LGRGARTKEEREFVRDLSKRLRLITPTERDWLRSGEIVRKLSHKHSFDVHKTREIHFDTLIALSARSIGGAVITANREHFERIQDHIMFEIVIPS
jgi:predicted nucleic acid-binding protein